MNRRIITSIFVILFSFYLCGCGNKIERNINKLAGDQEQRETAMLELTLAKEDAIEPLINTLSDTSKPVEVRVDIVTILFRILLRESDERILPALLANLNDQEPKVREVIVIGLGDLRKKEVIKDVLKILGDENEKVRYQAICTLEELQEKMSQEEKDEFISQSKIILESQDKLAREKAEEILAKEAELLIAEADKCVLQADIKKAEEVLMKAKKLVPDGLNVNYKLGRLYFDQGEKEKGLEILTKYGYIIYVPKFENSPVIDGGIKDTAWGKAAKIEKFYKCLRNVYSAKETEGKSELYVGYTDEAFYIGTKGYEDSTVNLIQHYKIRDSHIYKDDCWEIFLDTKRDCKTYYQIVVNCIGAVYDSYEKKKEWNGEYKVGAKIKDKFWSMEIEIPFKQLHDTKVEKGTIWSFNLNRFRATSGESCQWRPTYGNHHRPDLFGFLIFD
ncbi:MAG: HEAT repeat domain-containing protein [Candidatus Omnitrophica bacterium]|nr:HEAT repeat domain-containing protein [Candidatus Omnitrophota bacterium]